MPGVSGGPGGSVGEQNADGNRCGKAGEARR